MKNRKERMPVIVDLLTHKIIGSQEELLGELRMLGFSITQATLSRDLKQLKSSKVPNGMGGYRYVVSTFGGEIEELPKPYVTQLPVRPMVYSIDRSSNIIVVKTPASHAKLLANAFESLNDRRIIAAISVTDTMLLVMAPHIDGNVAYNILTSVISLDVVAPFRPRLDNLDA